MTSQIIGVRLPEHLIGSIWDYQDRKNLTRNAALVELITMGLKSTETAIQPESSQDRQSGADARLWALETAPKIAKYLDVERVSDTASEYRDRDGKLLSIRCAKTTTTLIGLYNTMRDRIQYVVGAFQNESGQFDLYKIDIETWRKSAREASRGNPNFGKLTMVPRNKCKAFGKSLGTVKV